ncbi:MAG: chitobiase/beta-hexosaminidase C-terminal domain-containing protein [Erysipelotrichales bacterium]|nr:chitobiase/beta-hexosaminidase C-terminal domain-containing protein [Erysipelotrichales bacterium]
MNKLKVIIPALIVFIIATIISVCFLFQSDEILVNFEILSVKNNFSEYEVEFSKVKAADYYIVQIHNSSNRKVYETKTNDEKVTLSLTNLQNNEEYSLMVFAYDKVGDYRPCEKEYKFTWDEPTFSQDLSIILNNQDYVLTIDGNLDNKDYTLEILNGDVVLVNEKLKNNEYTLNKELYENQEMELVVSIKSDDVVVDEIHLFNNLNPVTDISITNLTDESIIPYNDTTLEYSGGDNAENYEIKIYRDNNCIKTSSTSKKVVVLSKNLFSVGGSYRFEVNAKYGEYLKSTSVNVTMSDQIQLNPVYISNNWKYVKKGTKIELGTRDEGAKIYYTLDGKSPESYGILYTEPIEINENVLLRTVAVMEGYQNSIISAYEINVGVKEKLKVYLSPSNQHGNPGVASTGYTNEMDEMNDVTDYVEERLKSYGVIVYRNNPAGNINLWNKDSNYYGVDFKIAIHSNASVDHDNYGIETWVDTQNSLTYSIANAIQSGLVDIYPYKDLPNADRGVKYANGALGEANDTYIPFGILVEIAHHDYEDDARWIMENKKLIGYNIADSILKYYQVID